MIPTQQGFATRIGRRLSPACSATEIETTGRMTRADYVAKYPPRACAIVEACSLVAPTSALARIRVASCYRGRVGRCQPDRDRVSASADVVINQLRTLWGEADIENGCLGNQNGGNDLGCVKTRKIEKSQECFFLYLLKSDSRGNLCATIDDLNERFFCRHRARFSFFTAKTQSSGKARYVRFFRDTAVKLPVKRIIVGPADSADERSRALSRRLQ
jgi:hypothetical protein